MHVVEVWLQMPFRVVDELVVRFARFWFAFFFSCENKVVSVCFLHAQCTFEYQNNSRLLLALLHAWIAFARYLRWRLSCRVRSRPKCQFDQIWEFPLQPPVAQLLLWMDLQLCCSHALSVALQRRMFLCFERTHLLYQISSSEALQWHNRGKGSKKCGKGFPPKKKCEF